MSRSLLFAPLLLLLICCACEFVHGKNAKKLESFDIFVPKTTAITPPNSGRTFTAFTSPCLVDVGGVIVAFAAGSDASGNVDLVETHIEPEGKNLSTMFSQKDALTNLKRWVVDTGDGGKGKARQMETPTVVARGGKVFVYFKSPHGLEKHAAAEPVYQLAVGRVEGEPKQIKWKELKLLTDRIKGLSGNDEAKKLVGDGGSGVAVKDAIVIPVTYKDGTSLTVPGIIYSVKDNHETEWEFVKNLLSEDCIHPVVVEWEGKLIMMTSCKAGYRKVFESTDMGKTWTEALGTLSRVWGNTRSRNEFGTRGDFITATIDKKIVMLFLQPVHLWNKKVDQLRLWMTDGTHIYNADLISPEDVNATTGSLLYKDNKLYCLYEVKDKGTNKVVLAELTKELLWIKRTLKAWTTLETTFSQHCGQNGVGSGASSGKCAFPISTVGLVGFLSNRSDAKYWKEDYLCVSAVVTKGTWIPNGMRFQGVGAGAQWPVSRLGQDQRYHFANYAFTLAASVAIHAVPSADTPVLGVNLGRTTKESQSADNVLGLSITADGKWKIAAKKNPSGGLLSLSKWKLHETYHVALMMHNGTGSLYIDGQLVWEDTKQVFYDMVSSGIWQFCIGGHGDNKTETKTYTSAANVFLYNRTLNVTEVKALFERRVIIPRPDGVEEPPPKPLKSPEKLPEPPVLIDPENTLQQPVIAVPDKLPELPVITIPVNVPEVPVTTVPENVPEVPPKPVPSDDDTSNQLVRYGVTTYVNGLHTRREVEIPRDLLEKMKLGRIGSGEEGNFLLQAENVDFSVRERVGGVSFLLLGLYALLWAN